MIASSSCRHLVCTCGHGLATVHPVRCRVHTLGHTMRRCGCLRCTLLSPEFNLRTPATPRSTALRSDPSSKTSVAVMTFKRPTLHHPTPHSTASYRTALLITAGAAPCEGRRLTGVYVRALIILLHAGVGGQCGHYEPPYSYWCAETTQGGGAAQYVVPSGALLWHRCMTRYSITSTINERSDLHSNTMLSSPSRTCRAHSHPNAYRIFHNA